MSLNWVMLSPTSTPPFTPLPSEQVLYTSPPRIGLSISTPAHYPGKQQQAYSQTHSIGRLHLTNRRIIYLPDKSTEKLQSFAAPLLNIHDSHVTAPFFGPNIWIAALRPVQNGGIPIPSSGVVELKLTFKDGGAFDFQSSYERVRERLQQAVTNASTDQRASESAQTAISGVNLSSVNLDELPAYQEESDRPLIAPVEQPVVEQQDFMTPIQGLGRDGMTPRGSGDHSRSADRSATTAPVEPPPAYEEASKTSM